MAKELKNISEIRRFFHRNEDPIYFVSATNFNLLGLDEWVKNFKYICYIDCYGGKHPNVFCPSEQPHAEFQSIEDINNYLLQHKEVIDFVKRRGGKPKFVFLMFDEETERLSKELGAASGSTRLPLVTSLGLCLLAAKANGKIIITSNRDEKIIRPNAIEPKAYHLNNKKVIFPKDNKAGGTWYAIDEHSNVLVLLNGA